MTPIFHFEVRITNIRYVNNGNIDFDITTKSFTDEDPLMSRKRALNYYVDYLSGIMQHLGYQYETDAQSRAVLKPYIDGDKMGQIVTRDGEGNGSQTMFFGIAVFFINDNRIRKRETEGMSKIALDEIEDEEYQKMVNLVYENPTMFDEQLIHGIGYYGLTPIQPENVIDNLYFEANSIKNSEIDLTDKTIEVDFYDDELQEGSLIEIIPTPFDWTGYDVPRETINAVEVTKPELSIEQIIKDGESNQVEFKPSLIFNFKTKQGGIGVKAIIAKTLCGFLNSRGGLLFIGMKDSGQPQGLSGDFSLSGSKAPRDFFRLEFDEMIEHFLPQWVQNNIVGDFYTIDSTEIFVVIVQPSKNIPVFFNNQGEKEFYIRRIASTKQLDIEQFYYYWSNHTDKEEE
jgi:hypothetical protein